MSHEGWARNCHCSTARVALDTQELVERRWHFRGPGSARATWTPQVLFPFTGLGPGTASTNQQIKQSWHGFCWNLRVFSSLSPQELSWHTEVTVAKAALLCAYHINNKWLWAPWHKFHGRSCPGQKLLVLKQQWSSCSFRGGQTASFLKKKQLPTYIEFEEILCKYLSLSPAPPAINSCIPLRFMKDDLSEKGMSLQMTDWPPTYDHDPKPDEPFEEIFWIELGNGSVIETDSVSVQHSGRTMPWLGNLCPLLCLLEWTQQSSFPHARQGMRSFSDCSGNKKNESF